MFPVTIFFKKAFETAKLGSVVVRPERKTEESIEMEDVIFLIS
ncbi:MAG: hypothetical protein WC846_04480 [Candidatus Gracilibacteria bacterium]